ncbi:hypothetical protein [Mycobacterium intracellulare]|uniref:hypothetical protein n=1 Tax=Mycobacterium intracellulare TaxID=1767 RepID=UPI00109EAEE0|nr:hypothetical protein [Mycobacterium intracellulare]
MAIIVATAIARLAAQPTSTQASLPNAAANTAAGPADKVSPVVLRGSYCQVAATTPLARMRRAASTPGNPQG